MYSQFCENLVEMSKEMYLKLNNYLQEDLFHKFKKQIEEIQENCLEILSQFYIIVSKHVPEQIYDSF